MNLITIGGTPIKNPRDYSGQTTTLVEGGRNASGYFVGDVIRDSMSKVDASWLTLSAEEWSNILKLFDKAHGGSFIQSVTFLDQVSNTFVTKEMYVSDRTSTMKMIQVGDRVFYEGCKLALVEV